MNESAKARLAQLIKKLRRSDTQKDFAKRLGVTYGAVQSWENAEVNPSFQNLLKIADEAGMSLNQLMMYLDGENRVNEKAVSVSKLKADILSLNIDELAEVYRTASDRLVAIAEGVGSK